jgi:hypothetical protein
MMDIEARKQKLEGGEAQEWCYRVQCDACRSSFLVRVIRVHRRSATCFYALITAL